MKKNVSSSFKLFGKCTFNHKNFCLGSPLFLVIYFFSNNKNMDYTYLLSSFHVHKVWMFASLHLVFHANPFASKCLNKLKQKDIVPHIWSTLKINYFDCVTGSFCTCAGAVWNVKPLSPVRSMEAAPSPRTTGATAKPVVLNAALTSAWWKSVSNLSFTI